MIWDLNTSPTTLWIVWIGSTFTSGNLQWRNTPFGSSEFHRNLRRTRSTCDLRSDHRIYLFPSLFRFSQANVMGNTNSKFIESLASCRPETLAPTEILYLNEITLLLCANSTCSISKIIIAMKLGILLCFFVCFHGQHFNKNIDILFISFL